MLERPQEALFAEACRMLSAICGIVGEGDVPTPAQVGACVLVGRSSPACLLSVSPSGAHLLGGGPFLLKANRHGSK